tara:strand:- start:36958 stop:37608 length:651 start_codon:yes stop_codon:yes gene_type:complete
MSSVIDICNLALSNLRAGSINSLTESSLQAQQCSLKYPVVRDFLLRSHAWQFAHKIVPLAELADDVFNWAYVYQYPTDCLRINRLIPDIEEFTQTDSSYRPRHIEDVYSTDLTRQIKYEVANVDGTKVILANEGTLRVDYRARVEDTSLFDPSFIMAFQWYLAAELAEPIVGGDKSGSLRSSALSIYQEHVGAAEVENVNEQYAEPVISDFINVRS